MEVSHAATATEVPGDREIKETHSRPDHEACCGDTPTQPAALATVQPSYTKNAFALTFAMTSQVVLRYSFDVSKAKVRRLKLVCLGDPKPKRYFETIVNSGSVVLF